MFCFKLKTFCNICDYYNISAFKLLFQVFNFQNITLVDIDTDHGLVTRFGVRVPVVVIAGREVGAFEIRPGVIRRGVRRARWGRPSRWEADLPTA